MTKNTTLDVLGAIFIGTLFFGIIAFWVIGQRKFQTKLNEQAKNLKSKGLEINKTGMKFQTNYDLTKEEIIQRTSYKVQLVKDRIEKSPGLIKFGHKTN
ncbi:hypothetical protein CROQUDRAFT_672077 [Cronartium quercuum f. sp. fusiforme G11]|uniref:Uncharacterized protein n=1 Tax=Cronartium quercuum f. sp. fusiforme G11 TaxID=708437 RepID=A0A9P6TAS9_9BASI|nr:hypothetical protein CROQUDRAFT_672077 [Cronartium quercuum f. sp. fusiforme G11]